jgi:hypothetical protein
MGQTIQAKADACKALAARYGLTAIPWSQIIQMLMSMLTGCIPAGSARTPYDAISQPNNLELFATKWKLRGAGYWGERLYAMVDVLTTVGSTTTPVEADAMMSEAA